VSISGALDAPNMNFAGSRMGAREMRRSKSAFGPRMSMTGKGA